MTESLDKKQPIGYDQMDEEKMMTAIQDPEALRVMGTRIMGMILSIGVEKEEARICGEFIVKDMARARTIKEIQAVGSRWCAIFAERGYTVKIDEILMERNKWVADLIAPRMRPGTALEHDTGTAFTINYIKESRPDTEISLSDSSDTRVDKSIPVDVYDYDKKKLPYKDSQFDQALMITVLHHTDQAEKMFDEVVRTVKPGGLIFLFENTFKEGDTVEKNLNVTFDWFFNAVIHKSDLPLPFSHYSPETWDAFLKRKGFKILEKIELGQHKAIPLPHILYVAQKPD